MQIKQQYLNQNLKSKIAPIYILVGQDIYLLNESILSIKSHIKALHSTDENKIHIQSPSDWSNLLDEANSYSLFAEAVIIEVYLDKKSLDNEGKKFLSEYLKAVNSRCYLIIAAPNMPAKAMIGLAANPQVVIVQSYPLDADALKQWISTQLRAKSFTFGSDVPEQVVQYTQGNMLASAQFIEKMALAYPENTKITSDMALEQLHDQSDFSLYDLVDALLLGQSQQVLQILRKSAQSKVEPTLVLWMFSQELRNLLQLISLTQKIDLKTACSQLKIWPQRARLYQVCLKRVNQETLQYLLKYCQVIDERIKTSAQSLVWPSLENLGVSLCLNKTIGDVCSI